MTVGQINIWRAHVRAATLNAQIEGNEFSFLPRPTVRLLVRR